MIFGILWELISRQITTTSYESNPRFNSRFFFYLFLPSTVLESTLLLSNKWLFLNLLPILVHSIFGTLLYSASMGFTIYSLSKQNFFNLGLNPTPSTSLLMNNQPIMMYNIQINSSNYTSTYDLNSSSNQRLSFDQQKQQTNYQMEDDEMMYNLYDKSYSTSGSSSELNNLTLADCLVFGTILSSVDSTTLLDVFRMYQVNERLYYFVLGESLMNNAVVLIILNLLLEFFNASRLTVVKIYVAILQFFITLVGSVFLGFILAGIALVLVRLIKRFQVPSGLANYQNQCQATVETLLILKLAYLTYTLASLTGTSSIISLATFGILQDQYIIHNLNLRSQLTFKQVILATKTMGFSLIYPLLGMLLVEVATTSQLVQSWNQNDLLLPTSTNFSFTNTTNMRSSDKSINRQQSVMYSNVISAASVGASKLSQLANQANLNWNFKFLSIVTVITVIYRVIWVFSLSLFCNLFSSRQLKIKFKEQILVAFGGLKGPLAFAIVHRLIEHDDYRDRTIRNKHLFIYTVLFITFASTILKGPFIKPLVSKIQSTLNPLSTASATTNLLSPFNQLHSGSHQIHHTSIVFDEINSKVAEYVSSGLNSIIGHTKSPYDRFVELNETHIKPWLTRSSCNTNWLSVFYDTLILDETLNANCFYRSIGVFGVGTASHMYRKLSKNESNHDQESGSTKTNGNQNENHFEGFTRARKSSFRLDTIEENRQALVRRPPLSKRMSSLVTDEEPSSSKFSRRSGFSKKAQLPPSSASSRLAKTRKLRKDLPAQIIPKTAPDQDDNNSVLKEFVMLNLKLEEARRRRESISTSMGNTRIFPLDSSSDATHNVRKRNARGFLSSTDSNNGVGEGIQETSSFELKVNQLNKHNHHIRSNRKLRRSKEIVPIEADEETTPKLESEKPQHHQLHHFRRHPKQKNILPDSSKTTNQHQDITNASLKNQLPISSTVNEVNIQNHTVKNVEDVGTHHRIEHIPESSTNLMKKSKPTPTLDKSPKRSNRGKD